MESKKLKVVNIIPTYNEKENIGKMIQALQTVARKNPQYDFYHLIADDNSPDGTAEIVRKYMKKSSRIKLIEGKKVGLGEALIRSYKFAEDKMSADIIIPNDCDFSFDPNKIPDLLKKINEGYDVVVASRHVGGGGTEGWSLFRKLNHLVANELFAWYIAGIKQVHDHNGNFKAIRVKGVLDKIPLYKLRVKGFGFQCFIIYQLSKVTDKFFEIPVIFKFRTAGETKVSFNKRYLKTYLRDVLEYMWLCINVRIEKSMRFFKVAVVGGVGAILQFIIFNILRLTIQPEIATALAVEAAIVSNFIINNLWSFKDKKIQFKGINILLKFIQFNFLSLGSLIIQVVVMKIGILLFGRSFIVENFLVMLGILLGLFWNYFAYSRFVWKTKK